MVIILLWTCNRNSMRATFIMRCYYICGKLDTDTARLFVGDVWYSWKRVAARTSQKIWHLDFWAPFVRKSRRFIKHAVAWHCCTFMLSSICVGGAGVKVVKFFRNVTAHFVCTAALRTCFVQFILCYSGGVYISHHACSTHTVGSCA